MLRKIISLNILLLGSSLYAQNLVPNPSFDYDTACPWQGGEMTYAPPWKGICSADLMDTCQGYPMLTHFPVDRNKIPRTGSGCGGFCTIELTNNIPNHLYREYIDIKLISNLEANKFYDIKFYIIKFGINMGCATNNIGLKFSNQQLDSSNNLCFLDYDADVLKKFNPIITDTTNWTEIKGLYLANGDEGFLTIGNFENNENTDTINYNGSSTYDFAYYFIDDVSVTLIDTLDCSLLANAGADTLIHPGGKAFIGSEIANLPCTWYLLDGTLIANDKSNLTVSPSQTTTYVVEQNLCGNISYDTVTVFVGYAGLESEKESENDVSVSPNPNNGTFTIELNKQMELQELKLLDELGRTVKILEPKSKNFDLNLPKGLYFLEFTSDKQRFVEKMIVN